MAGSSNKGCIKKCQNPKNEEIGIWNLFVCAKVPFDPGEIPEKMEKFFDFVCLDGKTVEEKRSSFVKNPDLEETGGFSIVY